MLNMNYQQRVVIATETLDWQTSPASGVLRKPLARQAAEQGVATSIVRYLPGSCFAEHVHPLGEEIWVLDGVFADETGEYPAGSYLRNPPGSRHRPYSAVGCTLFVKLGHFHPDDLAVVRVNTRQQPWLPGHGRLTVLPLHSFQTEHTALVFWPAGEKFVPHRHWGGEEILVLSGRFCDEFGEYPAMTWLRSPHLSQHHPFVHQDTVILVKTGHLPD